MAAPRGRGSRTGGILRALGRLSLLVGLGFGVGLVIGLVAEEPALLYGHLAGDSESVPLARLRNDAAPVASEAAGSNPENDALESTGRVDRLESSPSADPQAKRLALRSPAREVDLPAVAAAPPVPEPAPKQVERASSGASSAAIADARATAKSRRDDQGQWAIQVGAFSDEAAARRLEKNLESKDYPVAVVPSKGSSQRWRVRVQPIKGEERARGMANRLKQNERLPTWLISLEAGGSR